MSQVAIIMPTKYRAAQLFDRVSELVTQPYPDDIYLAVVMAVLFADEETREAFQRLRRLVELSDRITVRAAMRLDANSTSVQGSNLAYQFARNFGLDWYVHGHDDLRWSEGWLEEALKVADQTGAQVIGLNDLHTNLDHFSPFWIVSQAFIDDHLGGYFAPPVYQAWWFDREICKKAQRAGLYAPAWKAIVEHTHPDWQTAEEDDTYREAHPARLEDKRLYHRRENENFPLNYTGIRV